MQTTGVLLYPLVSEYEISVAISVLKQGDHPITTNRRSFLYGWSDSRTA